MFIRFKQRACSLLVSNNFFYRVYNLWMKDLLEVLAIFQLLPISFSSHFIDTYGTLPNPVPNICRHLAGSECVYILDVTPRFKPQSRYFEQNKIWNTIYFTCRPWVLVASYPNLWSSIKSSFLCHIYVESMNSSSNIVTKVAEVLQVVCRLITCEVERFKSQSRHFEQQKICKNIPSQTSALQICGKNSESK